MEEFDKYAEEYETILNRDIWLSGEKTDYFANYKAKEILAFCKTASPSSIIDIGSGVGKMEKYLSNYFPESRIVGIDVSQKCIQKARSLELKNCEFIFYNGKEIPFPKEIFDLSVCANVFHHIKHGERIYILEEIRRVLKRDAHIFIFEHNPINPLTVFAVRTCEFDKGVKLLFRSEVENLLKRTGFMIVRKKYIVFFPYFARVLRKFEKEIDFLPFGAQYLVVGKKW